VEPSLSLTLRVSSKPSPQILDKDGSDEQRQTHQLTPAKIYLYSVKSVIVGGSQFITVIKMTYVPFLRLLFFTVAAAASISVACPIQVLYERKLRFSLERNLQS
jgi:hypothetical protein